MSKIKILFLAANPKDTEPLRLDEEIRTIDRVLRLAEFRDRFDIDQQWAVRVSDLQEHLLRYKPDIVHFSGHGSQASEIILENNSGDFKIVSTRALSSLFATLKDNIRCVVLNACYSEMQAKAIADHIDCVIGMSKAIVDDTAITFAAAFYRGIGYGRDVKTAFDLGIGQIDLEGLEELDTPKLMALHEDPSKVVFVTESANRPDAQTDLDLVEETLPNIVFDQPREAQLYQGSTPIFRILQAWFKNSTEVSTEEADARKVTAFIEFRENFESALCCSTYGQWAISKAPDFVGFTDIRDEIDIPPGHKAAKLNIALKYPSDQVCYAFAKESFDRYPDGRHPKWELTQEKYRVRVNIRGIGVNKDFWFTLNNPGPGEPLQLEYIGN